MRGSVYYQSSQLVKQIFIEGADHHPERRDEIIAEAVKKAEDVSLTL